MGRKLKECAAALLFALALALAAMPASQALAEGCGQDAFDPALIARARAREEGLAQGGAEAQSVPSAWAGGTPTTGHCHMLFVQVEFPDMPYDASTTPATLQGMAGACVEGMDAPSEDPSSPYPYESLHAYYGRSSYGALNIEGYTVRYEAAHERDHYTSDLASLYEEVMDALDPQIDFSRFDADGDGYIDGLYLEYSGESGEWASTWWPMKTKVSEGGFASDLAAREFDGKKLSNVSLIGDGSGSQSGLCTLIHETGHMLGLPDYYAYGDNGGGIGTDDMMYNNTGDQDAFSKWLLGWIEPDDVVRVVVGEDGVRVKRGMGEVEDAGDSLAAAVGALAGDSAGSPRLLAVSADEGIFGEESLFASFYLLQYDEPVGNQSYGMGWLGSAFRMYRVQAGLTDDGSNFVKSNAYGTAHDQLIECLDPSTLPSGGQTARQLTAGDEISPATTPSTNFQEKALGFTGIDVTVVDSGGSEGTVRVSYDASSRPDPAAFAVVDDGPGLIGSASYALTCSYEPEYNWSCEEIPVLYVDGRAVDVSCSIEGDKLKMQSWLDPQDLAPGADCELFLPKGYLVVGRGAEGDVLSDEMRVKVKVGPVAEVHAASYGAPSAPEGSRISGVSNAATAKDGCAYVIEALSVGSSTSTTEEVRLAIRRIDGEDPRRCETVVVDAGIEIDAGNPTMELVSLGDDRALLAMTSAFGSTSLVWLDLSRGAGAVLGVTRGADVSASASYVSLGGRAFAVAQLPGFVELVRLGLAEDGSLEARYLALGASAALAAGDYVGFECGGAVGLYSEDASAQLMGPCTKVVRASDVAALFDAGGGYASEAEAQGALGSVDVFSPAAELALPDFETPYALAADGEGFYQLVQGPLNGQLVNYLVAYGADGSERARAIVDEQMADGASSSCAALLADGQGSLAVYTQGAVTGPMTANLTALYSCDDLSVDGLISYRGSRGAWMGGRWLQAGYSVYAYGNVPELVAVYTGSEAPDPGPTPDPDPKPDPDPTPDPTPTPAPGAQQASERRAAAGAIPATGEGASFAGPLVLLAVCGLVASTAVRYLASHRNRHA